MNIREWFEGDEQDGRIETMQKIFALRDELETNFGIVDKDKIATCLFHALFGLVEGYPPCCVVEFVRQTYHEDYFPASRSIEGFQPCHRCFSGFIDPE